jgi:hypothetical protein
MPWSRLIAPLAQGVGARTTRRGDLAPIGELAPEGFADEHRGVVRADAPDTGERRDHRCIGVVVVPGAITGGRSSGKRDGVTFVIDMSELLHDEPQASDLAEDLVLEPQAEPTAVAGVEFRELTVRAIAARIETDDPLR